MKMTTYLTEPDLEERKCNDSIVRMLLYSLVLISPFLLGGITMAFPAIALPQMKLDISDASWFGTIHALLSPVGSLLVGIIIDKYGRRSALLLTVIPGTVGWFLLYYSSNTIIILSAQILNGITFGAIGYPSQVYAGECIMINRVHLRNYFATWTGLTTSFGTFVAFLLGYFLQYQQIAAFTTILALTSFLCIYFFIPESPAWLYLRGRVGDAEWSQQKLRIYLPILQKCSQKEVILDADDSVSETITLKSVVSGLKKVTRKDVYKPLIFMTLTFMLIFLAGGLTITTYMVQVLQLHPTEGAGNAEVSLISTNTAFNTTKIETITINDSYKYSVISGGLILIANFCASMVVVHVGVIRLTKFALFCAAVGMVLMGYSTQQIDSSSFWSTVHVLAVWLVAFMFNFGPVNVTWGILGDVFPTDAKGFASVCMTVVAITLAVSNKLYLYLFTAYGGYLYYVYSIIILIAYVFCHFFLPETVGKTLDQINQTFL